MLERQDIDALLIGSLYGELSSTEEARLAAHLDSHPADRTALANLTHARLVVRESRILQFQFEPPQSISALLIQEAVRRAPKSSAEQSWFQRFMRNFMLHPAMAAAAMLVLIVGVAGTMYLRKGDQFTNQTKDEAPSLAIEKSAGNADHQDPYGYYASSDAALAPTASEQYKVGLDENQGAKTGDKVIDVPVPVSKNDGDSADDLAANFRNKEDLAKGKRNENTVASERDRKLEEAKKLEDKQIAQTEAKPAEEKLAKKDPPAKDPPAKDAKKSAPAPRRDISKEGIFVTTPDQAPKDFDNTKKTVDRGSSNNLSIDGESSRTSVGAGGSVGTGTTGAAGPKAPVAKSPAAKPPAVVVKPPTDPRPQPKVDPKTTTPTTPAPAPGNSPAAPVATQPSPPPPAIVDKEKAEPAKPEKPDPVLAWAKEQHAKLVSQVKLGKCDLAATIANQIAVKAPGYYTSTVQDDRAVKPCMQYIAQQREKEAERVNRAKATQRRAVDEAPAPKPAQSSK